MRYVYLDLYFMYNLAINYVLLWVTSRLAGVAAAGWRLGAAAALGALYSTSLVVPVARPFFGLGPKLAFALLMVAVAFAPDRPLRLVKTAAYFFASSFLLGGTVLALSYLPQAAALGRGLESAGAHIEPWTVAAAVGICLAIGAGYHRYARRKLHRDLLCLPAEVTLEGACVRVNALVDTGNSLRDPFSRHPVMVVEYSALRRALPEEIRKVLDKGAGQTLKGIPEGLSPHRWSTRFRLIPFSGLGNARGLLLGFRPDQLVIRDGDRSLTTRDVVVGIHFRALSPEGSYTALLHPDLLQRAGQD